MKRLFLVLFIIASFCLTAINCNIQADGQIPKSTNIADMETGITNAVNSVMEDDTVNITFNYPDWTDTTIYVRVYITGEPTSNDMSAINNAANAYFSDIFIQAHVDVKFHSVYNEEE